MTYLLNSLLNHAVIIPVYPTKYHLKPIIWLDTTHLLKLDIELQNQSNKKLRTLSGNSNKQTLCVLQNKQLYAMVQFYKNITLQY